MSRSMLFTLLVCAAPACAWAQQPSPASTAKDVAPAAVAAKPRSHNAFGEAIAELTRAAQAQAAAAHGSTTRATPSTAPAVAPTSQATAAAPALADSSGG